MSLDDVTSTYNQLFKISKSNREVARIIRCYSRYGFSFKLVSNHKIYQFKGDLPQIHRRTTNRWREKLESL